MQQGSPGFSPQELIADYLRLLRMPVAAPDVLGHPLSMSLPNRDTSRPCALLLSPHPDDECLMGGFPLRLMQEQHWQIINVAVTLGSNSARCDERKNELSKACAALGFSCVLPEKDGFRDVNTATRKNNPEAWNKKVSRIAEIIEQLRPQALFIPHADDGHATHAGTHHLGMDALAAAPYDLTCAIVQTEYWQPMVMPNTMIGLSQTDAATLMSALACHAGEIRRNAYDRRFPAFLIDAVRRCEKLGPPGKAAPNMAFAQIYQLGLWLKGRFVPSALNRFVGANKSLASLSNEYVGTLFE